MRRLLAVRCGLVVFAVGAWWCAAAQAAHEQQASVLDAFRKRVEFARKQVPAIAKAADAAADRIAAHPDALLTVPYAPQQSFAEEILNRSGGLAGALPVEERPREATDHDVFLFSVRSWEANADQAAPIVRQAHEKGWLVVLFASRAEMPDGVAADYVIDNGSDCGCKEDAPVNAIANVLNAWLWNCEYVAALTRRGKCPAILKSGTLPDAAEHNASIQTPSGRHWMGECATRVPPGKLSEAYLLRVDELLRAVGSEKIQGEIAGAADLIAAQINAGRKVRVATATHLLMGEIFLDNRTPWEPFNVVWRAKTAFRERLREGDLLLWFSFVGMSSPYEDYGKYIRETKAPFIACFLEDRNAANNAPDALFRIEQSWTWGDAEVEVPCPPGRMAPVSGINQGLLYRMLDEAVAKRLNAQGAAGEAQEPVHSGAAR